MKRKLVIIIGVSLTIALLVYGITYALSLRKVTITLEGRTESVTIHDEGDRELKYLSESGSLRLQEGDYYAMPSGEGLTTDKIGFTVTDQGAAITIDPPLTKEFLEDALAGEESAIEAAIASKYPDLYPLYTIESGTLYHHGEWYGGLLAPKVSDRRDRRDPYRIVLHKKDGNWEVVRRPEYVLTSSRYGEVPIDILRHINQLVVPQ